MKIKSEHLLDPNCPWYELKAIRVPKIKWCEQQLCAWVEEPSNTWSNLSFILLGLLMWHLGKDLKSKALRFYGPAGVIVGVSSLVYHASNNFILQVFDFFGMYVFCYLLILINLKRAGKDAFNYYWYLVVGTTGFTVLADFTAFPIQIVVLILMLFVIFSEFCLKGQFSRKWFYISMLTMAIAMGFSFADHQGIFCDPHNHVVQGHAIWHLLGAFSLFFSFLHHRQFDLQISLPASKTK